MTDPSEYGGGGRGSDNYYTSSSNFESNTRPQGGGQQSYGDGASEYEGSNAGGCGGGYSGGQGAGYGSGYSGGSGGYGDGGQGGYPSAGQGNSHGFPDALASAQHHSSSSSSSSEDSTIFSSALGFLSGERHKISNEDLDEQDAISSHQKIYSSNSEGGGGHDSDTIGKGAAMQALKLFTTGGGGHGQGMGGHGAGMGVGSQGGGSSEGKFIGMAMAQASKLFDEQHGGGGGAVSFPTSFPPGG